MDGIKVLWPYWTTSSDEILKVSNAFCIAMHQHSVVAKVKTRKYTNQPYITHSVRLALRISSHPACMLSWVCAAFLHDTIEDTVYTPEEEFVLKRKIQEECGEDVLKLVEELTNENHDRSITNRQQRKEKDLLRLSTVSKPAKILKMLDRIDNLQEMTSAPTKFKKIYVEESRELLCVIGDADTNISHQLKATIDFIYSWRIISQSELEKLPRGVILEHTKRGLCFIEESGPGGHIKFDDGSWVYFDGRIGYDKLSKEFWTTQSFGENVFHVIMRETGEEK